MYETRSHLKSTWAVLITLVSMGFLGLAMAFAQADDENPPATPAVVDPRFGAIESFWAPQEAAELGVGWERILFYWNEIQPKDSDDWNTLHVLEEWLVEADAEGRTVVGLLKNTPAWATDGEPFSGVPRGLYLDYDDPDNLWANYVRRVVEYYAPRGVHNWIIWNEPEIEAGVYGHEFDGTVEEYVRLLQVAYLVAKENDPQAMIHLPDILTGMIPITCRSSSRLSRQIPRPRSTTIILMRYLCIFTSAWRRLANWCARWMNCKTNMGWISRFGLMKPMRLPI
jgi:hypothetical protein